MIVYNSLSKKKEKLISSEKFKLKIYSCGPTVYDYAHIGNLRTYIMQDLFIKTFIAIGYQVETVLNITDLGHLVGDCDLGEDKMQVSAREKKMEVTELALFYEKKFFQDSDKLNIKRANYNPKVSENMDCIIKFIEKLEDLGFVYKNENLYFDTSKHKNYGKMSNLYNSFNEKNRVELDPLKKNQKDFALWFLKSKYENHVLKWDSKWGLGYPGWHIECSALSYKFLGEHFDIHFGGIDHISTHHVNEIAQSESAFNTDNWVNYFIHMEFLIMENKKISKSSGDFLTLDKLIEMGFSPLEYRYFCLSSNYRKQLAFSFESMNFAKNSYNSLLNLILKIKDFKFLLKNNTEVYENFQKNYTEVGMKLNNILNKYVFEKKEIDLKKIKLKDISVKSLSTKYLNELEEKNTNLNQMKISKELIKILLFLYEKQNELNLKDYKKYKFSYMSLAYLLAFYNALTDDLNTSKALSVFRELLNCEIENIEKIFLIYYVDKIFSLSLLENASKKANFVIVLNEEEKSMIKKRLEYKKNKNFKEADKIREYFKNKGIDLIDTKNGSILKKK